MRILLGKVCTEVSAEASRVNVADIFGPGWGLTEMGAFGALFGLGSGLSATTSGGLRREYL